MSTPPPHPPADTRNSVLAVEQTADHVNYTSFSPPFASTEGARAHGDVVHLGVNNPAYNEIQHNYALKVTSRA